MRDRQTITFLLLGIEDGRTLVALAREARLGYWDACRLVRYEPRYLAYRADKLSRSRRSLRRRKQGEASRGGQ